MNWEAIGAIAELISGLGVIATLIYLAFQIRENTDTVRETNLRSQTDRSIRHSRFISGTPGMMSIFQRGMEDLSQLNQEERWQFGTCLYSMFLDFQEAYHLHLRNRLEDFIWEMHKRNFLLYLSRPGGREWWSSGQKLLDDEYVAYVNDQLV